MPPLPSKVVPKSPSNWGRMVMQLPIVKDGKPNTKAVEVQRHGTLVIHEGFSDGTLGCWCVTSVTCGDRITYVHTEEDAKRVAEYLWQHCRDILCLSLASEIVRRLPPWVAPWCIRLREDLKWVDPKEYQ